MQNRGFIAVIATNDRGSIVGYASVMLWKGGRFRFSTDSTKTVLLGKNSGIFAIAVSDEYQGRGIGTLLTEETIRRARGLGLKDLWLCTDIRNERALRLYRKFGFRNEEMIGSVVVMEKHLTFIKKQGDCDYSFSLSFHSK